MSMTRRDNEHAETPETGDGGDRLADVLGFFAVAAFLASIGLLAFFATTAFAR